MDAGAWLDQFVADDLTPLERNLALAGMREAQADAAAERDQAEKAAAAERRREDLLFHNRQAGDPLGQMSLARAAFTRHDDEVRDLEAQLEKARHKRSMARSNIEFWAGRLEPLSASAQRFRTPSDPVEAAQYLAHEAFKETTRAAVRSAGRPKGAGDAVRSEPVTCPECLKLDATPEESFAIHHSDVDGNVLSAAASRPVPASDASEVDRLMAAGYSPEIARLAQQPAGR
jgi:hypothetical protein